MDIGKKITEVLAWRHLTKQELGRQLGIAVSTATYITSRPTIDVEMVAKIGNILKYNFFKHYPVEEIGDDGKIVSDEKDKAIDDLKLKISDLEKQVADCKNDFQKQENLYLKKINDLLEKK